MIASLAPLAALFVLGAFAWTFCEYAIHYWLGHLTKGRTEFSREHLAHHRVESYFTPTPKKARAAAIVLVPAGILLTLWAGPAGLAPTLGFTLAYVVYELLHRSIHVSPPRTAWGRWACRHHLLHHHMDPRRNHGVTTPIWDHVFRTWTPSEQVLIVQAKAPSWLLDEEGALRQEYQGHYRLKGKAAGAALRAG